MSSPAAARGLVGNGATKCLFDKLIRRTLLDKIYPESPEYRQRLKSMLQQSQVTVYAGFDATSQSLHVGNLATLMNLLHFHQHGHRVICLIGDSTTRIGDPSGHHKEREEIPWHIINKNAKSIEETVIRIFKNHNRYFMPSEQPASEPPIIIRNSTWYRDIDIVGFVADIFKKIRVGTLLHKTSIQERLSSSEGMNLSEFSYQVFQAYDWLELYKRFNCNLQLGGSDQGGNIYTGHDLIKRCTGDSGAIGLLAPLILNDSGKKLGKSVDGNKKSNIWLRPESTSPYNLYQFFHRTPDSNVENLLKKFSFYDDRSIEDLIQNHLKKPESVWHCQQKLSEHVCKLVHGEDGLKSAKRITQAFFNKNPLDIASLSDDELYETFEEKSITHLLHREGLRVIDLMNRAGCVDSDFDAERLVSGGAVTINGSHVTSINHPITEELIIGNNITLMRIGKKNYFLFKWTN